jgi:N-acyl-D-aspartate/D-glutamate deacylase
MAKKEKQHNVVELGGNISGLLESVATARDKIIQLKKKRMEINSEIKAIREGMEAKGIVKKSFDLALSYFEASPEQREGLDEGYLLAREGMGLPVKGAQLELDVEPKKETA